MLFSPDSGKGNPLGGLYIPRGTGVILIGPKFEVKTSAKKRTNIASFKPLIRNRGAC
jgi:hypothetical protein